MSDEDIVRFQEAFFKQRCWRTDVYHYVGSAILFVREGTSDVVYGVWYGGGVQGVIRQF